ncbi:hypothetical protein H4I95_01512 [Botrytis cinerea]
MAPEPELAPPPLRRVSLSSAPSDAVTSKDRIFIASMHWNNELILRSHWSAALLDLVRHLGVDNVYISIVESGSWDNTKGALRDLDVELEKLGVERSIELLNITHKDEVERVPDPDEEGGYRQTGPEKNYTEDVVNLLATRDGNYAAACAIDFAKPPLFYDTFALRDIKGEEPITQTWPFFLATESRNAMKTSAPIPVRSCWNGIVVFQAEPFYENPSLRFRGFEIVLRSII